MEDNPLTRLRDELLDAHDRQLASAARAHKIRGQAHTARRSLRRRPVQLALALALAGVLAGVGLTNIGVAPSATPAAAAVLQRLARIAASGPSLVPGPGQYLSVRSVSDDQALYSGGCVSSAVERTRTWIAANGSGLVRDSIGPPEFTSAADQALCQTAAPTLNATSGTSNEWFAAGCYELAPTSNMQSLSTDPQVLLAQMRAIEGDPHTPANDFAHIGDFLRGTDARPALRAALYRAAALIPGVRLVGATQDHFGRQGLGVALATGSVSRELIFNRQTAALMGEQSTGSNPGSASWAVYFTAKVVSTLPKPAPAPLNPACSVSGLSHTHDVPGGMVVTG